MSEIINDWKPETRSLFLRLLAAGVEIVETDNGEDREKFKNIEQAIEHITATDEGHVYVIVPETKTKQWISLIYGNSPGELASEYSGPAAWISNPEFSLNKVTKAHHEEWSLKGQPKKRRGQPESNKDYFSISAPVLIPGTSPDNNNWTTYVYKNGALYATFYGANSEESATNAMAIVNHLKS